MKYRPLLFTLSVLLACLGCENEPNKNKGTETPTVERKKVQIPKFEGQNAYDFVKKQVEFGPRVPNTEAHKQAAAWMAQTFRDHGLKVIEQKFKATGYTGEIYNGINIIAQYNPDALERILFAAHWDSRFHADKDTENKSNPIDGADDGGSGVGVILEMSRILKQYPIEIGVDFVLFDAEDQGKDGSTTESDDEDHSKTWCLGSQYWANNLHRAGYKPQYAILLDMVGGNEAVFYKEGISNQVAPQTVNKVWNLANAMGYGDLFVNQVAEPVLDDHYFVIENARIPMIDVIATPGQGMKRFPTYHHTHDDNISNISQETLRKVGQVMTAFVYRYNNGEL